MAGRLRDRRHAGHAHGDDRGGVARLRAPVDAAGLRAATGAGPGLDPDRDSAIRHRQPGDDLHDSAHRAGADRREHGGRDSRSRGGSPSGGEDGRGRPLADLRAGAAARRGAPPAQRPSGRPGQQLAGRRGGGDDRRHRHGSGLLHHPVALDPRLHIGLRVHHRHLRGAARGHARRAAPEPAPEYQFTPVAITYSQKTCYAPVIVGIRWGIYEDAGLDVETKVVTGRPPASPRPRPSDRSHPSRPRAPW